MINFEEELKNFQPSLEVEEAEATIYNLDLKDVICIGDSQNDISMLEIAGKSVVMGNAKNEIKNYADFIALSNDEDGVARFLEQEFLS